MAFHSRSKRKVLAGPARINKGGHLLKPRIAVTLDEVDFANINWLAAQKGIPVAQVLRDAVWAYLLPYRTNPALKLHPPKLVIEG